MSSYNEDAPNDSYQGGGWLDNEADAVEGLDLTEGTSVSVDPSRYAYELAQPGVAADQARKGLSTAAALVDIWLPKPPAPPAAPAPAAPAPEAAKPAKPRIQYTPSFYTRYKDALLAGVIAVSAVGLGVVISRKL